MKDKLPMIDVHEDGRVTFAPNTHALLLRAVPPCDEHPSGAIEGAVYMNENTTIDTSSALEILQVLAYTIFNNPQEIMRLQQEAIMAHPVGNA